MTDDFCFDGAALLERPGFWAAHLGVSLGADLDAELAAAFGAHLGMIRGAYLRLTDSGGSPVFSVDAGGGARLAVVYRNAGDEPGVDYLLLPADPAASPGPPGEAARSAPPAPASSGPAAGGFAPSARPGPPESASVGHRPPEPAAPGPPDRLPPDRVPAVRAPRQGPEAAAGWGLPGAPGTEGTPAPPRAGSQPPGSDGPGSTPAAAGPLLGLPDGGPRPAPNAVITIGVAEGVPDGPALSWPELSAVAARQPDPLTRAQALLLLAPILGDIAVPPQPLSAALRTAGVSGHAPSIAARLAAAHRTTWRTAGASRFCDHPGSTRNPDSARALPPAEQEIVTSVLARA